jgi:hypothetical protein
VILAVACRRRDADGVLVFRLHSILVVVGQQVVGPDLVYELNWSQLLAVIMVLCGCKGVVRCGFRCFYRFFICPAIACLNSVFLVCAFVFYCYCNVLL